MFKKQIKVNRLDSGKILQVGQKGKTATLIENFYTKNPFPNYNDFETAQDLKDKVYNNEFLRNFKNLCGFGKKIIEVGSGTCQLSIALACESNNEIVAFDPTLESLRLGNSFAYKNKIENCTFVNGDLFDNPFLDEYFDIVWCSGVLHHTQSAERGFEIIAKWAKPNGYLIVGLYNRYGRLRTVFRQKLFKLFRKGSFIKKIVFLLDPVLRRNLSIQKKNAWFQDQYEHPVESLHSLDEVLKWFANNNVEFISSIPRCDMENIQYANIFKKQSKEDLLTRIFSQIAMLFSHLGAEGGLFIVIGKKK